MWLGTVGPDLRVNGATRGLGSRAGRYNRSPRGGGGADRHCGNHPPKSCGAQHAAQQGLHAAKAKPSQLQQFLAGIGLR